MKDILKAVFKKVKIRTIIILILLLVFNTYAWFLYATRVSGGITAHVSSWNIKFQVGEEETTTNIIFDVDNIYPGMETYIETIKVYNNGEMDAKLTYEVKSVTILGKNYKIGGEIESEDLLYMIQNDFPFSINISITNEILTAEGGEGSLSISLEWEFDSEDDELDTNWGEKAYEYYLKYPNQTSINIEVEITANQIK